MSERNPELPHLPADTKVVLTHDLTDDETCMGDFPEGTSGILVADEDDEEDRLFRPDGYPEGWGFYLSRSDYKEA